jgi:alkanesulfonate monooxygenase SsuD/methylene tetrahydromethanopterin reductase-like flavin-dependent oxidoreductase (luciferase family)
VEGAARTGRVPDRDEWRIIRDVYAAPTDAEARELAIGGIMGRCWREFMLPMYLGLGLGPLLKHDPSMPNEAIDLDYLADHLWFVGSTETVAGRIHRRRNRFKPFPGYFPHTNVDSADPPRLRRQGHLWRCAILTSGPMKG